MRTRLHEIKIEIPPATADATDLLLLEHGLANWTLREDAIARRAWLAGIFKTPAQARAQWAALRPLLPAKPLARATLRALANRDWRDSYKAHFKPWQFGPLHWIPVWQREKFTRELPKNTPVIWLDPGLAFGTGNHETTRLCVERLVNLSLNLSPPNLSPAARRAARASRVIDAGCGSGILALSAARLGHARVIAFDNDPEAIRVSRENAALNHLSRRVRFLTADLAAGLAKRKADIVLANIQADILMRHARELLAAVAPGGALILSGILAAENAQVREVFSKLAPNWKIETRALAEWSDIQLRAP